MASGDAWSDFQQTRHSIRLNTVDKLKHIIQGINEECHQQLAKSGRKQDIIQRIEAFLDSLYTIAATDQYAKIKDIVQQVRSKGHYHSKRFANSVLPPPSNIYNSTGKTSTYDNHNPGPSTMYNAYSIPRRPPAATASSSSASYGAKQNILFKDSPFYTIKEVVSRVTECPESTGTSDRRQAGFDFHLSSDQITRLAASGSKTQLRLFCTSSVFYAGNNPYAANNMPCLIEFPPTCEVRINTVQLSASLKGLKKKPGTAPPPDIGKLVKLSSSNRVDMVYLNTQNQQGVPPKKYYLVAMLVEVTNVAELVNDVKTRYRSSEEIIQQTVQAITDDDDIVAGPQKLSLKCPLSFVRIVTPTRSSKCVHAQCFDAMSWFSVMEQTTTWLCPVCEKVLDCKELIVDGYFDAILKKTPSSVDDVIVEPDGEWHTTDNKYASRAWKTSHPPTTNRPASPHKRVKMEESYDQLLSKSSSEDEKPTSDNVDVVVLDSDSDEEEDEGHVKRELSPSQSSQMNRSYVSIPRTETELSLSQQSDVIDLTADSDEERPTPTPRTGKRTADEAGLSPSSPTEPIWKKGRYDHDHPVLPPLTHIAGGSTHAASLPPRPPTTLPSPLLSYPVTPFSYPGYQNRPGLSGSVPQLPPLTTSHLPSRPSNSNTRWS
ncbi:PINIT domain containing protein [Amanita muscaria]